MNVKEGLELMDEMDRKNKQAVEAHKELIRGMFVDVDAGTVEPVMVCNELHDWYKQLRCDLIDIVTASIDGEDFAIVCDDEGLLKESPRTAVHGSLQDIVGNAMICRDTLDGQLASLSDRDIQLLRQHVKVAGRRAKNRRARMEIWHYIEAD